MHMKKGESMRTSFHTIRELSSISSFIILFIFSVFNIVPIAYIQGQFDYSPVMIAYKEIAEDCYPSAICDKEGRMHVVWQSDRKGNWDIYYTPLDDRIHKREFKSLTTDPNDDLYPSLAEDEKGNIWVLWVRNKSDENSESGGNSIWYTILDSQTMIFNEEKPLVPLDNSEKKSPSLVSVDPNRMLAIWISEEEKIQEIKYFILQDNLSKETKTLSHNAVNVRKIILGKTKDGRIFALWNSMSSGNNCLYFSIFDEDREEFLTNRQLGNNFDGYNPSVVVRKNEPTILFFCDENFDILYAVESTDRGASDFPTFSEPELICKTGAQEDSPVAVENNEEEVYLFWTSTYTGDNEIFFCHSSCLDDFREEGIHYVSNPKPPEEEVKQFVTDLTRDPNKYNANTEGYFCTDIFLSVAIIKGKLWLVWDSYSWNPFVDDNNVRKIKCMTFSNEDQWSEPFILMDNSMSENQGRDDRHPAIVETDDCIWLFWRTDRYGGAYDICYIKFKLGDDGKPPQNIKNEVPNQLTHSPKNDTHPAAASIGNRVYVVWQSDRYGNYDIFFTQLEGEKRIDERLTRTSTIPESNPSIAAYKGWHLESPFRTEHLIVSWDSMEKDRFFIHFSDLSLFIRDDSVQISPGNAHEFQTSKNLSVQSPDIYYVSRHKLIGKIFQKDSWFVWQSSGIASSVTSIRCNGGLNEKGVVEETQITDDLSHNTSPQVVEFDGKIWIFWDSNGGGNGRGIYYKYMQRRAIPLWLWTYSFLLVVLWILFLVDVRSRGGIKRFVLGFCSRIDEWFKKHTWYASIIIGVIAGLITYVLLQFLVHLLS